MNEKRGGSDPCEHFLQKHTKLILFQLYNSAGKQLARYLQSLLDITYPEERCRGRFTQERVLARWRAPAGHFGGYNLLCLPIYHKFVIDW